MKRKNVIITISILMIASLTSILFVYADLEIKQDTRNREKENVYNMPMSTKDPNSQNSILSEKEKLEAEFAQKIESQNSNDQIAGTIMKKYLGYDVIVLSSDKFEDYKTMKLMADVLKTYEINEEERERLKAYLTRRYPYIDNTELRDIIYKAAYE
jgi:hypothetical protein